jgi:hypothetical protein
VNLALWEELVLACKTGRPKVLFDEGVEVRAKATLHIPDKRMIIVSLANGTACTPVPCQFDPVYHNRPGLKILGAYQFQFKGITGYIAIIKTKNGDFFIKSFHASDRKLPTSDESLRRFKKNLRQYRIGDWTK